MFLDHGLNKKVTTKVRKVFGLNTAEFKGFKFSTVNKDGEATNPFAIMELQIGESSIKAYFNEPTKIFYFHDNKRGDMERSKMFEDAPGKEWGAWFKEWYSGLEWGTELRKVADTYVSQMEEQNKFIPRLCTAVGITTEEFVKGIGNPGNMSEYLSSVATLLAGKEGTPVDIFLQYKWSVKDQAKKTYLELPRTIEEGLVIVAHEKGDFNAKVTKKGLTYETVVSKEDKAKGVKPKVHPLMRSMEFLKSKNGYCTDSLGNRVEAAMFQKLEGANTTEEGANKVTNNAAPTNEKPVAGKKVAW